MAIRDESQYPKMCLPVGIEPKKPCLFWVVMWLNFMCRHSSLEMDGVGRVVQCAWPQIGFSKLSATCRLLDLLWFQMSRKILRMDSPMLWLEVIPVHLPSPSETFAQHIRSRGISIITWLDGVWLTNRRDSHQARTVHESLFLALTIFKRCGYFMSLMK